MELPLLAQFIIAIASLIIVHELGHFVASKMMGIPVEEFGIGFPPRIVRLFTLGGTDFTLNWIPLGGFVLPKGEKDPEVPNGLAAASPWRRIFVLAAGPAANLLAAVLLYALIFFQIGGPDTSQVQVFSVETGSPAAEAGLRVDDVIVAINGETASSTGEFHDLIYARLGEPIELTYERAGQTRMVELIPRDPPPITGAIGIGMGHPRVPVNGWEALYFGGQATGDVITVLAKLPGQLLGGDNVGEEGRLIGYKGMFDIFTEVRAADTELAAEVPAAINTFSFFASISISLGILNLMPFPALDGGRILFAVPEMLTGRRIPQRFENAVNLIGLATLLLLMIYVNLQDFLNPITIP